MTERVVLDASAALPLLVLEDTSTAVAARVGRWRQSGMTLVVPSLFWAEVTNALLTRHRRPGLMVIEALRELDELGIETAELDRPFLLAAMDLAERYRLSAYDAVYLALAETLDATLYTADVALLGAAGQRGMAVDGRPLTESAAAYERSPTWPRYREASAYLGKLRAEARGT